MKHPSRPVLYGCSLALSLSLLGCKGSHSDSSAEAPPIAEVDHASGGDTVEVDNPEQFPLTTVSEHFAASQLAVTGTVNPDVSRTIPVISVATGRVVEIKARLGDSVKKGDLLLRVLSADISGAFSDYRKAVADEQLARTQAERAKLLYDKGAISLNDLQVAEDTEGKAKVDVENMADRLRVLGGNLDHPSAIVNIYAPVAGVITDQQVSTAAGVQGLSAPANPFTISDLSHVWIVCDVHEDNLSQVHLGEYADVHLNAYPDAALKGRITNIGPILDPNIRTAKVRLEIANPGFMRVGMFVTATFHGMKMERHAAVPTSAILHLHDRDWVYLPVGGREFLRVEVTGGKILPNEMQEIMSGIRPGQRVATNALVVQNTVESMTEKAAN
jgi:cobalt-zinc-cadmium efflux system membrane fusion protein